MPVNDCVKTLKYSTWKSTKRFMHMILFSSLALKYSFYAIIHFFSIWKYHMFLSHSASIVQQFSRTHTWLVYVKGTLMFPFLIVFTWIISVTPLKALYVLWNVFNRNIKPHFTLINIVAVNIYMYVNSQSTL